MTWNYKHFLHLAVRPHSPVINRTGGQPQERNLERAVDLVADKYYEALPYPSLRGVETVLGFIEKDHPKAKSADPKSFVDDSLLREIDGSGFLKALYQR